ncbi:hypothetical protein [Microbaculum marinum]|uniref:Uncharacterized protein n=1 Tax=Microbaculum marinum TaxID=1764581 RepID=A0AAW9RVP7_9HYPH
MLLDEQYRDLLQRRQLVVSKAVEEGRPYTLEEVQTLASLEGALSAMEAVAASTAEAVDGAAGRSDLDLRLAEKAHDKHFSFVLHMNQSVLDTALNALKSAALINGGAAVATLAFLGALANRKVGLGNGSENALFVLFLFSGGVLSAAVGSGAAYLTQYFYGAASNGALLIWDHPYIKKKECSGAYNYLGKSFHVLAVFLTISCYILFAYGVYEMAKTVRLLL